MGIEIATLLGYISQTGGNSKVNGSRILGIGWGHVSREVNHANIHITREMILGGLCWGEQNLDLVVLTRDERLVISSDGMADYV